MGTLTRDLRSRRPELRLVPTSSGLVHVLHTRVETKALAALQRDLLPKSAIVQLYPTLASAAIN